MSPDRGVLTPPASDDGFETEATASSDEAVKPGEPGESFTLRGVAVGLVVALVVADAHAIQHQRVDAQQLCLSFGQLLQADLFGIFARDVHYLRVAGLFRRDVLFSQRLDESA